MPESRVLERRSGYALYSPTLRAQALATRASLLDALETALDTTPWHRITATQLARDAGRAQTSFYQYFPNITVMFEALMERVAEQGREPSEHMRLVAALLEFERRQVRDA